MGLVLFLWDHSELICLALERISLLTLLLALVLMLWFKTLGRQTMSESRMMKESSRQERQE